jgi:ParB-like chromosome segregation protein Spo0J
MKIINEALESVAVGRLKPHPNNPRQGDVGAIHQSIEANGFYGAVVAQKATGHVLAGNHRLIAAQHANAEEVPVMWVDVDDATALRILLADNRTNDLASYDEQALADLLTDIMADEGTLDGTGYDRDALDDLMRAITVPGPGEWGDALGDLPDGDKAPFQQMTFTLHDDQAEAVGEAMAVAKGMGPFVDSPNENANGNALARICETFLTDHRPGHG